MALDNTTIQQTLEQKFQHGVLNFNVQYEMLSFEVKPELILELITFLHRDHVMNFNFLTDVCGVHYHKEPESKQLAVVYHLHNWKDNVRIRFKTFIDIKHPIVDSVSSIFRSANWQERETYDFYGIVFKGHPQLKRILNMDEMTSFPLRKEFPLEDSGRTDKDDRFFGRGVHNHQE